MLYENYLEKTRAAHRWMWCMIVATLIMVMIGGITRLTGSGLSMVEWELVGDTFPPVSEERWQEQFEKYKASPEYQLRNKGMSLAGFKKIYFWEWFHRFWARLLGMLFLVPFVWFLARRRLNYMQASLLGIALLFGASQAAVGWFMVQSGLQNQPFVSHYRLALHFFIALFSLVFLLLAALETRPERGPRPQEPAWRTLAGWTWVGFALLLAQVLMGTFTAGLDAGFAYNTFPFMNGRFIPPGLTERVIDSAPWWKNFFDQPAAVQWLHRWLGVAVFFYVFVLWLCAQQVFMTSRQRNAYNLVFLFTGLQLLFGIAALVKKVPLVLGILHQITACFLVLSVVAVLHSLLAHRAHHRVMPRTYDD